LGSGVKGAGISGIVGASANGLNLHIALLKSISPIVTPATFSNSSPYSNVVAVSTTSSELLDLNAMTGQVIRRSPTLSVINHLHYTHSCLLAGSADGVVRVLDDRSNNQRDVGQSSVKAHQSGIQEMQHSGNFVYTIGWGLRYPPSVIMYFFL
jgi:PAB-dependent poly(A)-specific ribonuclease subunit 2